MPSISHKLFKTSDEDSKLTKQSAQFNYPSRAFNGAYDKLNLFVLSHFILCLSPQSLPFTYPPPGHIRFSSFIFDGVEVNIAQHCGFV